MLHWNQDRRNDALANRKRQWHATLRQQEAGLQDGSCELVRSQSEGKGPPGSERFPANRSKHRG
eukprot:12151306-Heterocapsa_arctica.AAC.1